MSSPDTFTGPVNLGNPVEVSVGDLAKKIIKMTGSKSKLVYLPLPEDDPKQRKPDISLAKKELKWQPVVDLETGLGKTIEYFKSAVTLKDCFVAARLAMTVYLLWLVYTETNRIELPSLRGVRAMRGDEAILLRTTIQIKNRPISETVYNLYCVRIYPPSAG